jgi:hypothetical protein
MNMLTWNKLEHLAGMVVSLRTHLNRAIGYGDEAEIRRLRAELAFIAKQRRVALADLNRQFALYA